mgnify:CR=1 FL=1
MKIDVYPHIMPPEYKDRLFKKARKKYNSDSPETPYTPAIGLVKAMSEAVELLLAEGMEEAWERHRTLALCTREAVLAMGLELFPKVLEGLKNRDITDVLVLGGGIIPEEDIPGLLALGIKGIFGPGTETKTIIQFIHDHLSYHQKEPL